MNIRTHASACLLLSLIALSGCGGGGGGSSSSAPSGGTTNNPPSGGVTLASATAVQDGETVGDPNPAWSNGATSSGGNGQAVEGLSCASPGEKYTYAHLTVIQDGKTVAVPANIGVVAPTASAPKGCVYPVHTRDLSGKLRFDQSASVTLGQFFAVWGMPLSGTNVAGLSTESLKIYTNDNGNLVEYEGELSALPLLPKREITLVLGSDVSKVPTYQWQDPPPLSTELTTIWGVNTVGTQFWADGATSSGGLGATTSDGIKCEAGMSENYHVHAHVAIINDGQMLAIPANIGLPSGCFYEMHTHDRTGIVHIEAPAFKRFTLGNFFSVWGQPLSWTNVAGITGKPVAIYVNDNGDIWQHKGDPADIEMTSHRSITIQIGSKPASIPNYSWGTSAS